MNKRDFPKIHFYDQDFVDVYDKTWSWLQDFWFNPETEAADLNGLFIYPHSQNPLIDQMESIFSTFFLVYSNKNYAANSNLDFFYKQQEESGAIRWKYSFPSLEAVRPKENPEAVGLPLFSWAEFNLYHKTANKKRIKEIVPHLEKYTQWLDETFKQENGLYAVKHQASTMYNSPRENTYYPVDFNACMAIHALYMAALGDILNDKDINFQYKRMYFSLKTRINKLMWCSDTGFYYDLNKKEEKLPQKTIAGFWPLLAEIPNEDKADALTAHLTNPETFGTDHPFPSLSADHPKFSVHGNGYCGSVLPEFNFMILKGLEKYHKWDLARESAIRHLYYVLETVFPGGSHTSGDLWQGYLPNKEGKASGSASQEFPKKRYVQSAALSTIAVMIENVIGLTISLPRKTVDWIIPNIEIMGIENLSLKRNLITILSNKSNRGWEIQMESEKLYYFTINILGQKKKTLPIPSGKCSMLIDKL